MADQSVPIGGTLDLTPQRVERPLWLEVLHDWVITVDHKKLGLMYMMMAIFFLLVGGLEAILIRIQLMVPDNHFVSPMTFNRLFTMHGTPMVFLVGMPLVFAWANFLIPLQIGARGMAFPRLNSFSFWLTFLGGVVLYYSFNGGPGLYGSSSAPDVTWWAYAPLTLKAFSPGHAPDYWALALLATGFGTLGGAINIVATVISMRCKGMTLMRMPLMSWLMLVDAFL